MRKILMSGYDEAVAPIGDLTSPLMESYAREIGCEFILHRKYPEDVHPVWQKAIFILGALRKADRVLWLDADTIITNPDYRLPANLSPGLHCSQDWRLDQGLRDFSLGNVFATKEAIRVYEHALHQKHWADKPLWEQSAMREVQYNPEIAHLIHVHPRTMFNAVPNEIAPDVAEPWRPGDWLCHLTGVSIDRKVQLFEKYKP